MLKARFLSTLFAVGALAPGFGCVIYDSDDNGSGANGNGNGTNGNGNGTNGSGTGTGEGSFDVGWKVDGESETGDGCESLPGYDHVEVVSYHLDDDHTYIDEFDCEDGDPGRITDPLPLGDYDLWANVRDDDGRLLAQSQVIETYLQAGDDPYFVDEELQFLNAQFYGDWALLEVETNQDFTCDEVNAGGVSLVSDLITPSGAAFEDEAYCDQNDTTGNFETRPLALGEYSVSIALMDNQFDEVLGEVEQDGELVEHATDVNLGGYDFRFGGAFAVTWEVEGEDNQQGDGCGKVPGVAGVEVVAGNFDDGGFDIAIFECEDEGGTTGELPTGQYDVWLNVIDADGRVLAQSEPHVVQGDDFDKPEVFEIEDDFRFRHGEFAARWELRDDQDAPLTCDSESVGAGEVQFSSTLTSSVGTTPDDFFECPAGYTAGDIESGSLPEGDYDMTVALIDTNGDDIATATPDDGPISIDHAVVTDLTADPFTFIVD